MININVETSVSVDINLMPVSILETITEELTFNNPKYLDLIRLGRTPYNVPKHIVFYTKTGSEINLPKGYAHRLTNLLAENNIEYNIQENTISKPFDDKYTFSPSLYDYQVPAVDIILPRRYGVLQAPTGSGKTAIALRLICERNEPTLIIVHNKLLANQWRERILEMTDIPENVIGMIGDGKCAVGHVTIAIINSLKRYAERIAEYIGHVVIDECHRCTSRSYVTSLSHLKPRYMLGISATPYRADGLTNVIYRLVGPMLYKIKNSAVRKAEKIVSAHYLVRKTEFYFSYDDDYPRMVNALTQDLERNGIIIGDIISIARSEPQASILVISDRAAHVHSLSDTLNLAGVKARAIVGKTHKLIKEEAINDIQNGNLQVLLSTSQLIGEGFDCGKLEYLLMTTPVKYIGRVVQYVGRVLRGYDGKKSATIYDYFDHRVGVLRGSYKKRIAAYESVGIERVKHANGRGILV